MNAYSKKYNYIIKYNAKSGCTLFRQLFLELHQEELTKVPSDQWHQINLDFPYRNEKVIVKIHLVRNPYHRVVSMFINKMCGKYNTLRTKITLPKCTFYHFVQYLENCSKNNNFVDVHIMPQHHNYSKDDTIIKLENFKENIFDVYGNYPGLKLLIPKIKTFFAKDNIHLNCSNIDHHSTGFVGLVEYDLNYEGPWHKHSDFYDKNIAEMVYKTYQKDFELFGYHRDSWNQD